MNFYSIRHLTRFRYSTPVSESIMETRMHCRTERHPKLPQLHPLGQPPLPRFHLPRPSRQQRSAFRCIPARSHPARHHRRIRRRASDLARPSRISSLPMHGMALDELIHSGDYWEMLLPSTFAVETPALIDLAAKLDVRRHDDPLMLVHEVNQRLFDYFEYVPRGIHALTRRSMRRLERQGRVPGLRPYDDCFIAPCSDSRTLRFRLSLSKPRGQRSLYSRCDPRLGRSPDARTWAGSDLTPPTTSSPITVISAPRSGATTRMSRPPMASSAARATAICTWPCMSKPAISREKVPSGMDTFLYPFHSRAFLCSARNHFTPWHSQGPLRSPRTRSQNHHHR